MRGEATPYRLAFLGIPLIAPDEDLSTSKLVLHVLAPPPSFTVIRKITVATPGTSTSEAHMKICIGPIGAKGTGFES